MAELVTEHYADVFRFCARRVGADLAEDASQETFVTAQRTIKRFDGSNARTWLLGIALNHCRNLSRKRRFEIPLWEWISTESTEGGVIDREVLKQALANLSAEQREAVLMHEVEGMTYDEISSMIGVPSGTVKSRLHHAFLNMRKALTGEQP